MACLLKIQENVKTLTQDRDNIQLLYEQVSLSKSLLLRECSLSNKDSQIVSGKRMDMMREELGREFEWSDFCSQATDEIQRLRRQVSQARSPSPSRAASAVLTRVESERDEALADLRRANNQLDNLEDKLKVCREKNINILNDKKLYIIQQIRAMPIYAQKVIVIRHPYITNILRYTQVAKIHPQSFKALHNHSFFRCRKHFVGSLLNNKTIILLNLAEYRLILTNSTCGLVG